MRAAPKHGNTRHNGFCGAPEGPKSSAWNVIMYQQRPVRTKFSPLTGLKPVQARQPPVILILKVAAIAEAQHLRAPQSLSSGQMFV